jgi:hypothetical protein
MRLAAVLIAKNEGPYLQEWVAHHRAIGFDLFLIYDHESTDDTQSVLARLACLPGVTAIGWSVPERCSPQTSAYSDALKRLHGAADYAAFFDADEFLIPHGETTLRGVLAELETVPDFCGLAINQIVFGPNGHDRAGPEPVLQRFPRRGLAAQGESLWVKSIYRLSRVPRFSFRLGRSAKWKSLKRVTRYNASGQRLSFRTRDLADHVDVSKLQLNHYITKSREEFALKKQRGGSLQTTAAKRKARYDDGFFEGRAGRNDVIDEPTLPHAAAIVGRMRDLAAEVESTSGGCRDAYSGP